MGQAIARLCAADDEVKAVAGFDITAERLSDFPVYSDPMEFSGSADVVVDFSSPAALTALLSYCIRRNLPIVLCTTGYTKEQLDEINAASERIPVFKSANMSMGINLLAALIKKAAATLADNFDIEIVERHHNKKVDAPSGTALLLADALADALPYEPDYTFDRHSVRQARGKHEIGITAVRGGSIPGEHEVIFAGQDEVIEFKHTVYSREVFASGAFRAAKFIAACKQPGMYDMSDIYSSI